MLKSIFYSLVGLFLVNSSLGQVPSNYPSNGLMGYWPLDSTLTNIANSNHQGSLYLTVPTTNRFNQTGKALYFNGINAYATLPVSVMGSLGSNNFTVSVWVAPDTIAVRPGGTEVLADRNTSTWNYRFSIGYGSNAANYDPDSAYFESIMASTARKVNVTGPTVGQWIQYTYVHSSENSGTVRAYANGQLINTRTGIGWNTGARAINVGRSLFPGSPAAGTYYLKGKVDDIAIWNRALTAAEVAALYNPCLSELPQAPVNRTAVFGDTVHFTVGNQNPAFQYQWQVNNGGSFVNLQPGTTYSGTQSATLVVQVNAQTLHGMQYRCVVANGNCQLSTQTAVLTVICQNQIAQQPQSVTQSVAGNAQFQIAALQGNATFQWQLMQASGFQNLTNFGQFSGVNTATLQIQNLTYSNNNQIFRCIVGGQGCDDTSQTVGLTVQCLPIINAQPAPVSGFSGASAQFNVQATGTGHTFQWQRRSAAGGLFTNLTANAQYSGVFSNQLQIQSLTLQNDQDEFRCIVTNLGCKDTSNAAVLLVGCATQITQQPRDTLVRPGTDVLFEVNFKAGVLYKWYRITGITLEELQNDSTAQGTNTNTLRLFNVPLSLNNSVYVCAMIEGECADTSDFAILRVNNTANVKERDLIGLKIYPNPAHQQLQLQRSMPGQAVNVQIHDLLGRTVFQQEWQGESLLIDVQNWPEGTYILLAGSHAFKFLVKHKSPNP